MVQQLHQHYGATKQGTPQSQAIPGREDEMVQNNAGGIVFRTDPWMQLNRFLVLGTEGGSYYANERTMSVDNAKVAMKLIKGGDGVKVVQQVLDVSTGGKAYKQDPALYTLALAFTHGDEKTKSAVMEAFPQVIRIGTHLFTFLTYATSMRGWGRNLRTVVQKWYQDKDLKQVVFQATKYQQRNGWSHRDVLRTSHPKPRTDDEAAVFGYIVDKQKHDGWQTREGEPFDYLRAVQSLHTGDCKIEQAVQLIKQFRLPREVLPSEMLNSVQVWDAMLQKMPMTALIRNLGVMTSKDVLKPLGGRVQAVVEQLTNAEALRKARVHPIQILAALYTYQAGHGARGKLSWTPVPQIVDALDNAFYKSFETVVPTGKRYVIGIDVSGSMSMSDICGVPGLTPCIGAAAMAMMVARTEPANYIHGFAGPDGGRGWGRRRDSDISGFRKLNITANSSLEQARRAAQDNNFGTTDCAVPMLWATQNDIEADAFVILTDNETWSGGVQPTQALAAYRKKTGIPASLAVVGMTSTGFTIADPKDARQMDFVGFSTDTPRVLADFVRGDI
jgi:60 kDa SS-A/Ro ribonucleoprotein